MTRFRPLFVIVLILAAQLMAGDSPRETIERIGFDQHLDQQIPLTLTFKDENEKSVALGDYFGKRPVIITLVYNACPMLCGAAQNGLVTCLRTMPYSPGNEFEVLTISFDPDEKTALSVQKKAEYMKSYGRAGADQGWHFLTGDKDSIDALTKSVGYRYAYDEKSKQYAHASGIVLLTPGGKISKYYYGIEYYPRDLSLGIIEASQNKIGTLTDQVLLYCYRYDPMTGKYGIVILNVLRIAGILTVLVLGSYIALTGRRDTRLNAQNGTGK
jgi:protein SCO1/2